MNVDLRSFDLIYELVFFILFRAVFNDDAKIAVSSLLSFKSCLSLSGFLFSLVCSIISNQNCVSSDSSSTIFNLEINSELERPLNAAR